MDARRLHLTRAAPPRDLFGIALLVTVLGTLAGCASSTRMPDESDRWETILGGSSLDGWTGDDRYWSTDGESVVGQSTAEVPVTRNTFLIWQGEAVGDFELRAEVQVLGNNNSGIQYRATQGEHFATSGYQCDIHPQLDYHGMLYEEGGRGIVATQGMRLRISEDGERTEIEPATEPAPFEWGEWHEYTIIARGPRLEHRIDGRVTVVVEDHEEGRAAGSGIIAVQIHVGAPYEVRVRNVRLRQLDS